MRTKANEPKRAKGVRIDEQQIKAVKRIADEENRTFSNMVSVLISEALAFRTRRTA